MEKNKDYNKECFKCGYNWKAKVENPVACPKCKFRFDRYKAFKKHNFKCCRCSSEENLVLHHPDYDNISIKDLVVLCKRCHFNLHKKTRVNSPMDTTMKINIRTRIKMKRARIHPRETYDHLINRLLDKNK